MAVQMSCMVQVRSVARVRPHGVWRGVAAAGGEIRRVCNDEVKAPGGEQRAVRAQVGAEDLCAAAQAVCSDVVACELCRVRLQFNADGGRLLQRAQQQHRQHARAAAEVGNAPCAALRRKIGQQHAVRAEGKPRRRSAQSAVRRATGRQIPVGSWRTLLPLPSYRQRRYAACISPHSFAVFSERNLVDGDRTHRAVGSAVPHSMQLSALMTYLPLPSEIASAGQFAAQVPHMTQSSPITKAIVITSYVFHRVSLPLV